MSSYSNPKIDHIGIAVRSIDQSLEFYRDALGVEPSGHFSAECEKVEAAVLPLGESHLELLEPSCADSVIAQFIDRRGEGLHHIAIRVPDLERAAEKIRTTGSRLVAGAIQTSAGGYRYVFIHPKSASGVLLELIEYPGSEAID